LAKDEVEKMAKDAEEHAGEDRKRIAEVEARNKLDTMVYHVEKLLHENREKLAEDDVKAAEAALEEARKALHEGAMDRIGVALDGLTKVSHKMAEAMYQKPPPGPRRSASDGAPAGETKSEEKKQGEVIDAEYVDVDDKR
jgi:molecular chaperone DnaK